MDYWSSSLGFVTGCLSLLSHLVAIVSEFDPNDCPLDCSRPCEIVCPANAISLEGAAGILQVLPSQRRLKYPASKYISISPLCFTICIPTFVSTLMQGGVITERCYGCGRCLPVCPYDKISRYFICSTSVFFQVGFCITLAIFSLNDSGFCAILCIFSTSNSIIDNLSSQFLFV